MTDLGQVGERVREHRQLRRWNQPRLAKKAGISTGYLSAIERGQKVPSLGTLFELAKALKVPPSALVPGDALAERAWRRKLQQIIDWAEQLRELRFDP